MSQNSSIKIDSKYFIDRLENDIVQLARALSVEHSMDIEQAKLAARQIIQRRLNTLLTPEEKNGILDIRCRIETIIKMPGVTGTNIPLRNLADKTYELLKSMELL